MFKDEIIIHVKAGNGGNGCTGFNREKFKPKGGPDGGNGGKGGNIIIRTSSHLNTLYHLTRMPKYAAKNGINGQGSNCHGKNGTDLIIEVPVGTIIKDAANKNILKDLKELNQEIIAAKGGRGGKGNQSFATSTNQAPRYSEPGGEGE